MVFVNFEENIFNINNSKYHAGGSAGGEGFKSSDVAMAVEMIVPVLSLTVIV